MTSGSPRLRTEPKISYRADIDGLRAIAVLSVILFHAGFEAFSGGFVGVDVFFVISGYLMTATIVKEMERGRFSIARFYERRARRILPALFFVLLLCLPVAWLLMFPTELERLGRSLLALSLFASNIHFWQSTTAETTYFAEASEQRLLLHTWSLGVEEQFYLVLPVFLIICWRFGMGTLFLATGVIAAVSLGLAEWGWRHTPVANFYLLPARAWELLVGSCIAYWHSPRWGRPVRASALARDVLTGCGLGLVGLSILTFDSTTPFPGLWALVPTIGAGLIIAFGSPHGYASSVLALRPVVLVGLISYSAYLWHQPGFAFARISTVGDLSTRAIFLCVGLSLGLAVPRCCTCHWPGSSSASVSAPPRWCARASLADSHRARCRPSTVSEDRWRGANRCQLVVRLATRSALHLSSCGGTRSRRR